MKKINNYLLSLELNPKRTKIKIYIYLFLLLTISILLSVFNFSMLGLLSSIGVIFVGLFALYFRFGQISRDNKEKHWEDFVNSFTYFRIFLENNVGIYQSLIAAKNLSSSWLKDKMSILIQEINNDKTIKPFISFANNFSNDEIEPLLITIYQMIDKGTDSDYLKSFSYQFDKTIELQDENFRENFDKSLKSQTLFCLVGTGLFTLALMFGVISMMENISYGI